VKVLLISPLGFPINSESRYTGIEALVLNYARELSKSHDVTVLGHSQSVFPDKVTHLKTDPTGLEPFAESELRQYQAYQGILRNFNVIHDFSHQHFASRYNLNLPSLNIFWHAPNEVQYDKSPYNIIGLSHWACRSFKQYYHQEAYYQQSIAIDTSLYVPNHDSRSDRFLTLGVMSPQKGNLSAAVLCKEMGVPLDIVGRPENTMYVTEVMKLCDDDKIKYHGEVDEQAKLHLMRTCKALIYVLPVPEVTSHKVQEAMLCGAPVIATKIGALPEIITQGVDGFLCSNRKEFDEAIKSVGKLTPKSTYRQLVEKYSIEHVVSEYVKLYDAVARGLRW